MVCAVMGLFLCSGQAASEAAPAGAKDEIFPATPNVRSKVDWKDGYFVIDGKPTFLTVGELHYARIPRELWRDRIWRVKQMGFNCIQLYVFWNAHEAVEGQWNFSDNLDLDAFLTMTKEMGMYAIVRPGPYICAEWEHGGFPAWLTIKPGMVLRDMDEQYNKYADRHLSKIYDIVSKHQIQKGGNVIMVQLENEHAKGWGTVAYPYLMHLYEKARQAGLEVPLFFSGLHHGRDPSGEKPYGKGTSPWYSTEFWTGWIGKYGDMEDAMLQEKIRGTWKIIAFGGGGYGYYVVHGGTNFGYSGDSLEATYDYSSPIGEAGQLRNLYGPARRAAMFAETFSGVLTSSENAPEFASFTSNGVRVTTRKSPQGTIVFADNFLNPADKNKAAEWIAPTADAYQAEKAKPVSNAVVGKLEIAGEGEFPKQGNLTIPRDEIRTAIFDLPWTASTAFESITSNVLLRQEVGGVDTWVLYGNPGEQGEITIRRPEGASLPRNYSFEYPGRGEVREISISSDDGKTARFLVIDTALADRTWPIKNRLLIGASFVREDGSAEIPLAGGKLITYDSQGRTEKSYPAAEAAKLPALTGWASRDAARERLPDFDDKAWSASRNPQAMEAYDDFQNRYGWYRATIRCDAPEMRNLRFSGLSGDFQAFLNGRPADLSKLDLKQGENTLAIFSRIGPRPKLFLFMGLIGTNGARGLWGPTYSGERPIIGTSEWKMTKVADKTDTSEDFARPGFDDKTWQTIGTGSFDAKAGEIFRLRTSFDLPSQEGPILALLPEASKESQRIFLNGKPLPVGKRDNGGFDATSYLVPGRNTLAMEFIAKVDKKNEKAWVNPRFELWRPDEPLTWKFRGGLEGLEETAIIGRVLNWREFLDKPWSTTEPGAGEFPRFWKTTFSFSPKHDETIGLDVTGLGNGHIWVNGHNLGGTPQTVPLYIPECWLNKGPNEIVVFDTQGRKPESLRLVGYESHQIVSAGR